MSFPKKKITSKGKPAVMPQDSSIRVDTSGQGSRGFLVLRRNKGETELLWLENII